MKRIILQKIKVYATSGYKYILSCNTCGKSFTLGGNNFNKGRGYFCSRKCRSINPIERLKNSRRTKNQFKNGRIHPRGMKGKNPWNKGKENPYWKKDKNPNWNNGSSYEKYGEEFNKKLKRKIMTKYYFTCQECGNKAIVVHHIDYNKKNNEENNLISLCSVCHGKTNFNRKDWIKYFKVKLKNYDICRTPTINKIGEVKDKKLSR